ncbi:MAG: arylsulfatase [Planctomycetaceae bacterium]
MNRQLTLSGCLTRALLVLSVMLSAVAQATERPNVLMIMVDDLGFSDLGCYGSEINTPTLDQLAADGMRFSQFYNTAKCHSSRVCLLTGQYCLAAGDTALTHAVTSAEVLKTGGYFTAMTGKWHLNRQPTDFGFQRYFGHLSGACNYFSGDKTFRLNGEPWTVPDNGFYTTVANVDYSLKFLEEARLTNKPWFLYVAFNAPHAPLQALPQDYAKYQGRYDAGWDVIREARVKRQQQQKLLPDDCVASERPDHIPAWDSLTPARKQFEVKRMRTLAAMIDRVDQEIGRLVDNLKQAAELDNTLIWFVSDNGACPYDRASQGIHDDPTSADVSWSDSTGWAWARNSPFRFYKQNQFEGGICTPAIVHWPAGLKIAAGSIEARPAHLIDVLPTIADVTACDVPTTFDSRTLRPMSGQSLRPMLEGDEFHRTEPLHFLFASDRGLRDGDWKLVSFRGGPWEIYNLRTDRTERHNLATTHPDQLHRMVEQWNSMATDVLHAKGNLVAPVSDVTSHQHPEWTNFAVDPHDGVKGNSKSGEQRQKRRKRKVQ